MGYRSTPNIHIDINHIRGHPQPPSASVSDEDDDDLLDDGVEVSAEEISPQYSVVQAPSHSGSSSHHNEFDPLPYPSDLIDREDLLEFRAAEPGRRRGHQGIPRSHNTRTSPVRREPSQRRPTTTQRPPRPKPPPTESPTDDGDSTEEFLNQQDYEYRQPRTQPYHGQHSAYTHSSSSGSFTYPPVPHHSQMVPYGAQMNPLHPQYPQMAHGFPQQRPQPGPQQQPPPHQPPPHPQQRPPQAGVPAPYAYGQMTQHQGYPGAMAQYPGAHPGAHMNAGYPGSPPYGQPHPGQFPQQHGYFPQYPQQHGYPFHPQFVPYPPLPPHLAQFLHYSRNPSPHPAASSPGSANATPATSTAVAAPTQSAVVAQQPAQPPAPPPPASPPAPPPIDEETIMKRFEALFIAERTQREDREKDRQLQIQSAEDKVAAMNKAAEERRAEEKRIRAQALRDAEEDALRFRKEAAERAAEEKRIREEARREALEAENARLKAEAERAAYETKIRKEAAEAALAAAAAEALAKKEQADKEAKIASDAAEAAKSAAEKKAADDAAAAEAKTKAEREEAEKKLKEATEAAETAKKNAEEAQAAAAAAKAPDKKAPVKFKDALGRNYSFPWERCHKWDDIEGLINQAFAHIENLGPHVLAGHYDLIGADKEIIMPDYWEDTVQPGMQVTMMLWPMPEPKPEPEPEPLPPPPMEEEIIDIEALLNGKKKKDKNGISKKKNKPGAFASWMLGGGPVARR